MNADTGSALQRLGSSGGRRIGVADAALAAWIAALTVLTVYGAATTTGFMTVSNLKAILTAAAFVGIIAIGLTVIMLSGNLFSLALGQTAAVTAMFFLYSLQFGLAPAIVLTLLLGLVIGAVQGFAVGAWGANPIIITIGAAGLMEGLAVWLSHGQSIVPPASATSYEWLAQPLFGVPFPVYVFLVLTALLEIVMRRTRFGREIYLMGENRVAARAAALPITLLATAAFALTSVFTAGAGILIGASSQNASLLLTGELYVRRDRRRTRRGQRRNGRTRIDSADRRRRDLHRNDLGHAVAARLHDRRADPRPRDHRRRRRRLDEPQGAKAMNASRLSTIRTGGLSRFVPYAILAADDPHDGVAARRDGLHRPYRQRVRHPAELRVVRPCRTRLGDHDHGWRVRPLRLVDVPPRRNGGRPHRQRIPARGRARGARHRRSSSAAFRAG